ncbi:MAG: hypothetical protein WDM80_04910 [Limisphaerales bacterium]
MKSDELLAALTRGKVDIDADQKEISESKKKVNLAAEEITAVAKTGASTLQEVEETKKSFN